jgi:competence protein ComEC
MVKGAFLPSPLVIAAIAAGALVYIPFPLFRLVVLCVVILLAAVIAASAMVSWAMAAPVFGGSTGKQFFGRLYSVLFHPLVVRIGLSAAAGAVIGFASIAMTEPFAPGLPVQNIVSIQGKLLDDPRSFAGDFAQSPDKERGMAVLALSGTESDKAKISARGRVAVYFPEGTMPRLREFGRNAELYAEGRFLPAPANAAATGATANGASAAAANRAAAATTVSAIPRFVASSVHVTKAAPMVEQIRTIVRSAIIARLKPKAWGGLAAALLLGTRENLEGELAASFRDAGLSHILALSGMHLAFLSAMLAFVLRKPLGKKASVIAGLVFIVVYVFLVGPQPSLVRAALMYGIGALLILSGTTRQSLALLSGAFLVQILWDPASPHTISFMLSYLALAGILLVSGAFLVPVRGRLPAFLGEGLGASASAFLATSPVVAFFFGVLRPAGIIASLFAAPLSGLFMALSLLWLFAAELPLAGMLLDRLLIAVHFVLQRSVDLFSKFPGLKVAPAVVCIITPLVIAGIFMIADRRERYRNEFIPFAS